MITRHLHTLTTRDHTEDRTHHHLVVDDDGLGFVLHDVRLTTGSRMLRESREEPEAIYALEGSGRLVELRTGRSHALTPGSVVVVERDDRVAIVADTRLRLMWVGRVEESLGGAK